VSVLITALAPAAWGTTYLVTTELLPPDRPLLAGVLRALPAGVVLAAVTKQRPAGRWWGRALVLGTLNIGAFFALLFVAAYRLPGGVAATLGAIQPLLAAGLAAVLLRERVRPHVVVAGALGVLGVSLLVLRAGAQLDGTGVLAGLAGATSMATGVVLTKRWGRPVPLLAFTSWQLVAGGLVLLPVALAVEGPPPHLTGTNLLGYLWLGTVGTAVAYSLWFRGIERLPVARVSLLGLLSPVVATVVGWLVLQQGMTGTQLAGAGMVLGALWLGQRTWPSSADRDAHGRAAGGTVHHHPDRAGHLVGRGLDVESLGDASDDQRELHLGEGEPDAVPGTPPERHPARVGERLLLAAEITEAVGIEPQGVGPGVRVAPCQVG
jgi:probable blue pigment (indigoidine) exporter